MFDKGAKVVRTQEFTPLNCPRLILDQIYTVKDANSVRVILYEYPDHITFDPRRFRLALRDEL